MNRSLLPLIAALLLLAGCNNPTYINVPNDGNDLAINSPNQLTVKAIQKAALGYLLERSQIPGDIGVRFPEGTTEKTAINIVAALPDNVFAEGMTPTDEYQLVEVREISARGGLGRVDVIRPGALREREFVEVHLVWDFWDGWIAERLQVRNFGVERVDPSRLAPPGREPVQPQYEQAPPQDDVNQIAE